MYRAENRHEKEKNHMNMEFKGSEQYVASNELMTAVNIAVTLRKPLLIKGEPGTG